HELRGRMDAVIVGRGTLVADNPLLTARAPGPRTPTRVVLTASGELPASFRLLDTIGEAPVLILSSAAGAEKLAGLRDRGCEVIVPEGSTDVALSIDAELDELGRRQMTNVLVEGGAGVLGAFLDAQAVNEVHAFVAPVLVGGGEALSPIG